MEMGEASNVEGILEIDSIKYELIYYDLETTGLDQECHITEIAALDSTGSSFSTHVRPKEPIEAKASEITGIKFDMEKNVMTKDDVLVDTTHIRTALHDFITFLRNRACQPILVGHNIIRFDNPRLRNAANNCGLLGELNEAVKRCIDTYEVFRGEYRNLASYKQENLVARYLHETYEAHGAIADATILKKLVEAKLDSEQLGKYVRNFS